MAGENRRLILLNLSFQIDNFTVLPPLLDDPRNSVAVEEVKERDKFDSKVHRVEHCLPFSY